MKQGHHLRLETGTSSRRREGRLIVWIVTRCAYLENVVVVVPFDGMEQFGQNMRIMDAAVLAEKPQQLLLLLVHLMQRVSLADLLQLLQVRLARLGLHDKHADVELLRAKS